MNLTTGDTRLIIETCRKAGLLRNQCAYVLATAYHETAHKMKPIRELGGETYLRKKKYYPYVGMGYVQLTWLENYEKASGKLGVDFVADPKKLLEPRYAAPILVTGMAEGWFTGKKLSDYITAKRSDFKNARRIVNAMDRAQDIADLAKGYDALLKASGYGEKPTRKPAQRDEPAEAPAYQPMPLRSPEPAPALRVDAILHRGSRGDFVAELQDNLNTLGFGPINVDGDFGYATERAVKAFQTSAGLKADGWAGPRTLEAIGRAVKDLETAPKLAVAEEVIDQAASGSRGVSKTEVITTVTGVTGVATVVNEAVETAKQGADSLLSLGPWILLALILAGGAAWVIWDRRKKRITARAAQQVMH